MPATSAQIFGACAKAFHRLQAQGDIKPTGAETAVIRRGKELLLDYIAELCKRQPHAVVANPVLRALDDLHPRKDYSDVERAIGDVADLALTFARTQQGRSRSSSHKLFEAHLFCVHLRDEL